jgi:hypothetical protein
MYREGAFQNMPKMLLSVVMVFLLLFVFSLVGALTFPALPSANSGVTTYIGDFLLLFLPVILLTLIAFFLGTGIRSIKKSIQALGLAYVSALVIGGVLALLTVFNFPYSAHVNFGWLGSSWYSPWLTLFLIGSPIMLAFVV